MKGNCQKQRYGSKDEKYELRVEYGDLNNCNLKCPFCFTQYSKQNNVPKDDISNFDFTDVTYVKFTGGEPLINQPQIEDINNKIKEISKNNPKIFYVIQTNGLIEEMESKMESLLQGLENLTSKIIIEFSFKGTNVEEYQYLTRANKINQTNASLLMKQQVDNYHLVKDYIQNKGNVALLPRLGIFHSGNIQVKYRFVYPYKQNMLMFQKENWSDEIKSVFEDYINNSKLRMIPVEPLITASSEFNQIGKRYSKIISSLLSRKIIREYNSVIDKKVNLFDNVYCSNKDASFIYENV